MAQNYAEKYAGKVDERFTKASLTNSVLNNDYDFDGVKTVNIYSIDTVALEDYQMSGTNRYGTPDELNDTVQTLTLTQDKAFTFTIDKRNAADSNGAKAAGVALRRQIDERVIPTVDKYRLAAMVANAGINKTGAVTAANAYEVFLDLQNEMLENNIPATGRTAFVSPLYFKSIKLDDSFIQASDMAQEMLVNGSLGMVDNVPIVPVPASYLPENAEIIIVHKSAVVSPVKLANYFTHENPPGINGTLVEGRIYFDAFVLNNKKMSIAVHKSA